MVRTRTELFTLRTNNGPVHDSSVLQLDGDGLTVQLHEESIATNL